MKIMLMLHFHRRSAASPNAARAFGWVHLPLENPPVLIMTAHRHSDVSPPFTAFSNLLIDCAPAATSCTQDSGLGSS